MHIVWRVNQVSFFFVRPSLLWMLVWICASTLARLLRTSGNHLQWAYRMGGRLVKIEVNFIFLSNRIITHANGDADCGA